MNFLDDVYKELSAINEGTIKEEVIVPIEDAIADNDTGIKDPEAFLEYLITEASIEFQSVYENYVYDRLKNSDTGKAIINFIEALLKKIREIYGSFKAFVKKWAGVAKAKAKKFYDDITKNKADVEDCENEQRENPTRKILSEGGTVSAKYCIYQITSNDIKVAFRDVFNVDSSRGIIYNVNDINTDKPEVLEAMAKKFNEIAQDRTDEFFTELLAHTLVKVRTSNIEDIKSEIIRINGFKTIDVNKNNLIDTLFNLQKLISSETKAAVELDETLLVKVLPDLDKMNKKIKDMSSKENMNPDVVKFLARIVSINVHVAQTTLVIASAMNTTIQKSIATFEELSGGEY